MIIKSLKIKYEGSNLYKLATDTRAVSVNAVDGAVVTPITNWSQFDEVLILQDVVRFGTQHLSIMVEDPSNTLPYAYLTTNNQDISRAGDTAIFSTPKTADVVRVDLYVNGHKEASTTGEANFLFTFKESGVNYVYASILKNDGQTVITHPLRYELGPKLPVVMENLRFTSIGLEFDLVGTGNVVITARTGLGLVIENQIFDVVGRKSCVIYPESTPGVMAMPYGFPKYGFTINMYVDGLLSTHSVDESPEQWATLNPEAEGSQM